MKELEIKQILNKVDGNGYDFYAVPSDDIFVGYIFIYEGKRFKISSCGDPGATSIKSDKGNWNITRFSAILL